MKEWAAPSGSMRKFGSVDGPGAVAKCLSTKNPPSLTEPIIKRRLDYSPAWPVPLPRGCPLRRGPVGGRARLRRLTGSVEQNHGNGLFFRKYWAVVFRTFVKH